MRKRIVLFCLAVGWGASAQTKPPKPGPTADTAQEAAVIEHLGTRVHYENDGTGTVEHTRAVRIQSEAGVEQYGQLGFGYPSAAEKLEVDYVRVRKPKGQTIETSPAHPQDFAPEIRRSGPMYNHYPARPITAPTPPPPAPPQ